MVKDEMADILSEFARTMVTDFPIQGILDHLVKRIVEVMPITGAGVTLITPGIEPQYIAASDSKALRYEQLQTELGEGPCLAAYTTGEAISVPDLAVEDRFPTFTPRALEAGLSAVFTFPLRHGADFKLGALDLYRDEAGPLTPETMAAAQTLADVAAAYLINAQTRADLVAASEQSRDAALHDPLTGLPNRTLILQLIEHAFRSSRRSRKLSAVMFVDLNHFKEVNDTHGHQVGDALLVAVAQRLTRLLRPGDSVARLAGDEFVILCEDVVDTGAVDALAVRLDTELSRPFDLSGIEVTMSASIGIAFTGQGTDSPEELLLDADVAMYQSKRDRDGSDVLDLRQLHVAGHQAGLARGLSGAMARDELHLEYQPLVESADGRIIGVEALLRWDHPSRGPISPTVFIPFAEQSGLIVDLGRWVLEQACADRQRWQHHSPTEIAISVNVSVHQFMLADFADGVQAVLAETSTDPSLLTLEVTESVFMHDEKRALIVLDELKRIGVKLALDDFGTGYSSLGYLNAMPIDSIKIDRSFISQLIDSPSSREIVSAIIGLAHGLGMSVVAEGVETPQQRDKVAQLGADLCQGFHFARPMLAALLDPLTRIQTDGDRTHLPIARDIEPEISGGFRR